MAKKTSTTATPTTTRGRYSVTPSRRQPIQVTDLTAEMARNFDTLQMGFYRILPEAAEILIARNHKNRRLSPRDVERYAEMMKDSGWKLNHQPITFNANGELHNGQHRLEACIYSNTPFVSLVTFDADPESFNTVDTHRKRTAGDALSIRGEKNCNVLARVLNMVLQYELHGPKGVSAEKMPAVDEGRLYEVLAANTGVREAVDFTSTKVPNITPSTVAFVFWMASQSHGEAKARAFFEGVRTGENLVAGDPRLALRNRLLREAGNRQQRLLGSYVLALTIKAWNAFAEDRMLTNIRYGNVGKTAEEFPAFVKAAPAALAA